MKRLFFIISLFLPLTVMAQSNWERPADAASNTKEEKAAKAAKTKQSKAERDAKYLAGAVTEVDGRVQWDLEVDAPGKSAEQIYNSVYEYLKELTSSENQLEGSQVALVNKAEHSIVATVKEWLIFKQNAISIDRAATSFVLSAVCKDNHLSVTLTRIIFDYTENVPTREGIFRAEEWITDKEALNKKGTKLYPGSARFRRKMCDRKDEIFNGLRKLIGN